MPRRKTIWINRAKSFREASDFEREYYSRMTAKERLEIVQLMREMHFRLHKGSKDEGSKGLRRVVTIVKQP